MAREVDDVARVRMGAMSNIRLGRSRRHGETVPLAAGAEATVFRDDETNIVTLSVADDTGATFTVRMPSQAASDLAVAIVNAANGL